MFGLRGSQPRLTRRWRADGDDHVIALAFSPDGKTLAAASVSGPVVLLDATSGKVIRTLGGHGFGTTSVSWRRDGAVLATAGQDGKAKLWDAVSGEERASLACGSAWVEHISWHPSADVVVTAAGKKLRFWDADGQLLRECPDHPATIADLAWRPRTGELTTGTYGGVRLYDVKGEQTDQLDWKGSVLKLAWAPEGARLAHGNQDATVHYWVLARHDDLQMAGYPLKVREVCWDPTGTYLATGGGDVVTVWDTTPPGPADTEPMGFQGHTEVIAALAYQAGGPLLASGGQEGFVFLWQPGKFKKSLARSEAGAAVSQLVWSPRDDALAVGTEAGAVVYYSVG
jgi:WD40 repeat protein